jgi:hypothetical protein
MVLSDADSYGKAATEFSESISFELAQSKLHSQTQLLVAGGELMQFSDTHVVAGTSPGAREATTRPTSIRISLSAISETEVSSPSPKRSLSLTHFHAWIDYLPATLTVRAGLEQYLPKESCAPPPPASFPASRAATWPLSLAILPALHPVCSEKQRKAASVAGAQIVAKMHACAVHHGHSLDALAVARGRYDVGKAFPGGRVLGEGTYMHMGQLGACFASNSPFCRCDVQDGQRIRRLGPSHRTPKAHSRYWQWIL